MRLALTLSAALMATGAVAFVPAVPSARRGTKLVSAPKPQAFSII